MVRTKPIGKTLSIHHRYFKPVVSQLGYCDFEEPNKETQFEGKNSERLDEETLNKMLLDSSKIHASRKPNVIRKPPKN